MNILTTSPTAIRTFDEEIANALGSIEAAVILQQLHYWMQKEGVGVIVNNTKYIYNTFQGWLSQQFKFLTESRLRKGMNILRSLSIVEVIRYKAKQWNQTNHYTLNYERLKEWAEAESIEISELCNTTSQESEYQTLKTEDSEVSLYESKNTNKEKQTKKNIEQEQTKKISAAKNKSAKKEILNMRMSKERTESCEGAESQTQSIGHSHSLSQSKENACEVDEKVNKEDKKSIRVEKPRLKKDMARHIPEGDRYFDTERKFKQQRMEVRERAKTSSVLGMSGFKSVEQMERCEDLLVEYFARKFDYTEALNKAHWIIKDAIQGKRSPLIRNDFMQGLPIGTSCMREWEIEPGVIYPVFMAYLRCLLRKNEDTHAQSLSRVSWELKDTSVAATHWAECKRLIAIEKPRLFKAVEQGQNPASLKIPEWIIEIYRPEVAVEDVAATAEALGAIAAQFNQQAKEHQQKIAPSQDVINELPDSSPIKSLLRKTGVLGVFQPQDKDKRTDVDTVMDKVVMDKDLLDKMPQAIASETRNLSAVQEINSLLNDPITRPKGLFMAKKQNLPLLHNREGVAIGIDFKTIEDGERGSRLASISNRHIEEKPSEQQQKTDEGHGAAHQIYSPPKIEKGSKSAWEEAIARSKFLQKRKNTM